MRRIVATRHQRLDVGGRFRFLPAAGRAALVGLLLGGALFAVNAAKPDQNVSARVVGSWRQPLECRGAARREPAADLRYATRLHPREPARDPRQQIPQLAVPRLNQPNTDHNGLTNERDQRPRTAVAVPS
jgi:hypothetical protein